MKKGLDNERVHDLINHANDLMSKVIEYSRDPGEGMVIIMGLIMIHGRLAGFECDQQVDAISKVINSNLFRELYYNMVEVVDSDEANGLLN